MRRAAIQRLLPQVYQDAAERGGVLGALLDVMEVMHAPSERCLAAVEELFDPYRCPPALVPFLAGWVAVADGDEVRTAMPLGRLRNLVAEGAALAQRRGTAAGIRAAVEIATGVTGVVIEEPEDRPFHIVVRIPAAAAADLPLVRQIVEMEKPAAVTCEVHVEADESQVEKR